MVQGLGQGWPRFKSVLNETAPNPEGSTTSLESGRLPSPSEGANPAITGLVATAPPH